MSAWMRIEGGTPAGAARSGPVDYVGPNLSSSQLIVYAPGGPGSQQSGPNGGE